MKECSALWILAPITRAVDDQIARKLLGDSFRRQLKFDGAYSAITLVCSKTDDISIQEAADSLQLDKEVAHMLDRKDAIQQELGKARDTINSKSHDRDGLVEKLHELDEEIATWKHLAEKCSLGLKVYAPASESPRKRKRLANPSGARKNFASIDSDDEDSGSDTEQDSEEQHQQGEPLDGDQIAETISSLKLRFKEHRTSNKRLGREIKELNTSITDLIARQKSLDTEMLATCIQGRNEYARNAIQQDFARGIKE